MIGHAQDRGVDGCAQLKGMGEGRRDETTVVG